MNKNIKIISEKLSNARFRKKFINKINFPLQNAYNFFIYHYDKEFQETTYQLYKEKIESMITVPKIIINEFYKENVQWSKYDH